MTEPAANGARYMVDTCSFTELRRAYPRPAFDAVWKLVEALAAAGRLLSIDEVLLELKAQDDEVSAWASAHESIFLPLAEDIQVRAREVLAQYPTLVDWKRRKSSADPFVIAAAEVKNATVVTQEKPSGGPPAVKIPDVCRGRRVQCIPLLEMLVAEDLTT